MEFNELERSTIIEALDTLKRKYSKTIDHYKEVIKQGISTPGGSAELGIKEKKKKIDIIDNILEKLK